MTRSVRLSLILLLVAPAVLAQDFNRAEFYGGYSRMREKTTIESFAVSDPAGSTENITDLCSAATGQELGTNAQQFFCKGRNFGGFELGATWNFNRWFGVTGMVTRHSKKQTYVDDFGGAIQTIGTDEHITSVLAGVQFKDNGRTARFKPFAHVLAGTTRYTDRQSQLIDVLPQFNYVANDRESSLSLKIGGGVDIMVTPHIDVRAIEVDYTPIYAKDRHYGSISGPFTFDVKGKTADDYTVGFGIVLH